MSGSVAMPVTRDFPLHVVPPFEGTNSEIVRSIQQRDLLNKWLRLYAAHEHAPAFTDYNPDIAEQDHGTLVYYNITTDGGDLSIVIDSYGTLMSRAYGASGTGRELKEYLGPERAALVIPIYRECISRQLPVYTISRVEDKDGHAVDFERLLLPFREGEHITHIIGSFETISMDGHFELKRLMSDHVPVDVLKAVIEKDLFFTPPPRIPAHDKVEFE